MSYKACEVVELTGIPYQMLNYWIKTGVLTPSVNPAEGSGSRRRFSDSDIDLLKLIAELTKAGFRDPMRRKILDAYRRGSVKPIVVKLPA